MRHLDDVEEERYRRARIVGDDFAEHHACLPVEHVPTAPAPAGALPEPGAPGDRLSLAGEWRMASHRPAAAFSIGHWTAPPGQKPKGGPPSWWREDTDRSGWLPARVPGTVQSALVEAGVLPDPHRDDATWEELTRHGVPREWPWHFRRTRVEEREWWLARRFTAPAGWAGSRVLLRFDGLDYAATVYVNGTPLRHHTGMFGGPDVEVTELLRHGPGETNEVVVRLFPPPRDWHGVPKGSPGWGWHYGHLISMGIWREVWLERVPAVEVTDLFVRTVSLEGDRARLSVTCDLTHREAAPLTLSFTGRIAPADPDAPRPAGAGDPASDGPAGPGGAGDPEDPAGGRVVCFTGSVTAHRGTHRYAFEVTLEQPRVWWPLGYGAQPLHRLDLAVRAAGADGGEGPEAGSASCEFGVRTIEMAGLPDWPGEENYRWRFVVNGRPLFVKGANWCWTDPLLAEDFEAKNAHLLTLARDANIQLLRAWGGGIVESDAFYRACDRLGILVYQEFPLTFGLPEAPATDLGVLDRQVSRIVRRLRNHPSLVMWGGGNENAHHAGADEPHLLMGRRCRRLDPSRPFHRTSPEGGSAHNYTVYHEGLPVDVGYPNVDAAFYGEYGIPSQPAPRMQERYLPAEKLAAWPPPEDGGILAHQAQFGLFDLVKQLRYADYGPVAGWETLAAYGQLAQGDALRYASEMLRARSGAHTSGFLFYKLTDLFPGASWSVVDFYGVPKLSYWRVRQFCRARCGFAFRRSLTVAPGERFTAGVHLANDTPRAWRDARVTATLYGHDLTELHRRHATVTVAADARVHAFDLDADCGAYAGRLLVLRVAVHEADGTLASDQWYWYNDRVKPGRIRELEALPLDELAALPVAEVIAAYAEPKPAPLLELPRTRLTAAVSADGAALEIANEGPVPAVHVVVEGFDGGPGTARPADNALGLGPGERRRVPFEGGPAAGLPHLSVRAFNAPPARVARG
ncbi:glycoside hydrolase family 2 protein [Streptomyces hoynatensis]|uniref:beta-mannosidase n=1 Tax=Streptomyces hoynatensis TaxID=1141874 RepID=A0A3A9YV92_9ACTN|nr:glycoside hydrolase family 2 TIM barrel-domain containing protein [Streptomyces hoynatensis]RKN39494.1 hypothetical protein D7294_21105 [Streptomyces hoynatensis]